MTGPDETWKLDELAERAGVAPRTVRYYVQRGLLPAPVFRGKDTAYGRGHLARLRAIKRLQAQHLPLDAIQAAIEGRSDDELEALSREPAVGGALPSAVGAGAGGAGSNAHGGEGRGAGERGEGNEANEGGGARQGDGGDASARDGEVSAPGGGGAGNGGGGAGVSAYERWRLLPGLELHLDGGAGAEARAMAIEIVQLVQAKRSRGAGK